MAALGNKCTLRWVHNKCGTDKNGQTARDQVMQTSAAIANNLDFLCKCDEKINHPISTYSWTKDRDK